MRWPSFAVAWHWGDGRPKASRTHEGYRVTGVVDDLLGWLVFGWGQRERLYRHLSVQVANDVTWLAAFQSYRGRLLRHHRRGAARIIGEVLRGLNNGRSLTASLSPWIPADEAMMIASGEQSGRLPGVLEAILSAKGKVGRVKRLMFAAIATPAVYSAALYGLLWAIGEYFLPALEGPIPQAQITGPGASLFVLGRVATSPLAIVPLVALIGVVGLVVWSLPRWTGRTRVLVERAFPFSFYRDINGYLWLLSFSTLLSAGQPDVKVLSEQAKRASPWMRERVLAIRRRMENGASLPEALHKARLAFPNPDMIDDIGSMAGFRDFPTRIAKVADQWAAELEWRTAARVKTLGLVFDLLIYGIMGYVLVAINSMSTQLGSVPRL